MLANYLIGLREGLEASLIVGILVAYLVKVGARARLPQVWVGVAAAVGLSLAAAAALAVTSSQLTFRAQEVFGGVLSILAVGFVTWMVFWMRRTARGLSRELRDRMGTALVLGGGAVLLTAFVAVVREGLETAVFLWAALRATGDDAGPLAGAALGLATAVLLGWLVYRGALRIDLGKFFTWTGAALILVAAGVLAYGVHDLQEAGVLPGLGTLAFDVSGTLDPASWYAVLLKGTVNFTPAMTVLQVVAWALYVAPVGWLFFRPARPAAPAAPARPTPAPSRTPEPSA